MLDRPLLIFPTPQIIGRSKKQPYIPKIRKPSIERQSARLFPMFRDLQMSFADRRIAIQQSTDGIDPEEVLIIETIGSIEKLANAVKHISGFEWLGEIYSDDIPPDEDFYDIDDPSKNLNGRLFLVMSNQSALNQMVSLWDRYRNNPEMKFQKGLTKFRDIFLHLKNIRRWDAQDRLLETGILVLQLHISKNGILLDQKPFSRSEKMLIFH